jgi:hypothetical protein
MIKKIVLVIVFFLFAKSNFAQSKLRFGVSAGLNYATYVNSDQTISLNPKLSFLVGVKTEYKVHENIWLDFDLLFERKSTESDVFAQVINPGDDYSNPTGPKLYYSIQNDYLVFPIQIKYEPSKVDSFYFGMGFYTSYLLKTYFFNGIDNGDPNRFKKFDYGLNFTVGKNFNINDKSRFSLGIRYNLGISDVNNYQHFLRGGIKINTLCFVSVYSFDLK